MNRRAFLKSGGSAAALLLSRPAWCAAREKPKVGDQEILAGSAERIEQHRKGDGIIVVRDAKSKPVRGARIRVDQVRHDFLFGCNFFMFGHCGAPELEEQYRQRFAALLNYCTLGFYWAAYERVRGQPNYEYSDRVAAWVHEHGITPKGHPLVWDLPAGSPRWLPDDPKEIERLSMQRVRDIVARFQGRIDIWDVVNEATHLKDKPNKTKMADWAAAKGAVPYVEEHLKVARAANPRATLLVNDYRIDPPYYHILERLQENGKPLFDCIGIQSHMHDGVWPLHKAWDTCETYSKLGQPLHFTESTIVSGPRKGPEENWGPTTPEGEARQAEATAKFYTVLFSHPAVQAITWWDFSDLGAWQGAAAGWLRRDMSPKPVYGELLSLIKSQWWTKAEATTDRQGEVKVRAFYGTHRVTADLPSGECIVQDVHWERVKENRFEDGSMSTLPMPAQFASTAVLAAFALTTAATGLAQPTVPIPAATNIFAHLNKAHPRLLATTTDFDSLKQRIAAEPQLRAWHKKLQEEALGIQKAAPSVYEIPDGLRLLATSRRVVQRVYTLALIYRLDGDRQCAARAWQELAAAANFPDWNPRHFLDTAEMTHAFAIGYDWLYDFWLPEQRAMLQQAMVNKGLNPALKLYRAHSSWTRMHHNWNQVCNGGIGMGALALAEVEPQLAGEALHDALESVQIAMAEFAPDGAWKEGPGYWNYATSYNVVLLAGLNSALGTDFGLSGIGAFNETGLFPIYMTGPLGRTFNYADGGDHTPYGPQLFWLGREFKQPVCAWYERRTQGPSVLDLLWFDPAGASPKAAGLPLDKYYRGAEVALMRSDWDDPRALFVGFKAGDNKANHSHLDLGTFVFDAAGARWAMDLGADDYNLPGYFGRQRWDYYRLRTEGHNTLVLNPGQAPDQDPAAVARIVRFKFTPERSYAIADLTPAYAKRARRVWRGLALLDRDKLLVQDEVQADKPVELWWFMHTQAGISVEQDGHAAHLHSGSAELEARIISPADARFEVIKPEPLPTSPHAERQATNEGVSKLAVHLRNVSDCRLAVLLVPKASSGSQAGGSLKLSALADW